MINAVSASWFVGQDVECRRMCSLLNDLKSRFLQATGPPDIAPSATVEQQRSECELQPKIFRDHIIRNSLRGFNTRDASARAVLIPSGFR
jgi:hypothetical protein